MYLVVRSSGNAPEIVPAIRTQLAGMDSTLPLAQVRTMDELLDESLVQQRFRTWLISGFRSTSPASFGDRSFTHLFPIR